jgi:ethanolamine transporter EutH
VEVSSVVFLIEVRLFSLEKEIEINLQRETEGLRGQCSVGINCLTGELCFGWELRKLTSAEHKIKYGIDEGRRED